MVTCRRARYVAPSRRPSSCRACLALSREWTRRTGCEMKAQVSVGLINPGRRVCLRGKRWSSDGCHISLDLGQSFSNHQGHASPGRTTIFCECTGPDHPRSKKRGMKAAAQKEAKTRRDSSRRDATRHTAHFCSACLHRRQSENKSSREALEAARTWWMDGTAAAKHRGAVRGARLASRRRRLQCPAPKSNQLPSKFPTCVMHAWQPRWLFWRRRL